MFDIKTAHDIPGWTWNSQLKLIDDTATKLKPGSKVLEIGCAWGRSTWQWLDSLPDGCELYVIDAFMLKTPHKHAKAFKNLLPNNETVQKILHRYGEVGHYKTFLEVIDQHPKKNILKDVMAGRSSDFYSKTNRNWQIVYIDGAHDYNTVKNDIDYYGSKTEILCGDDYGGKQTGVIKAVDEYVKISGKSFFKDPEGPFWKII